MRKRPISPITPVDIPEEDHHATDQDHFEIKLPKISLKGLANRNYTPLLVVGLVITSFLLGTLVTKVQVLEQAVKGTTTAPAVAQAAVPAVQPTTPPPSGKIQAVTSDDRIRGNANAKVTLVEYSDYECPFCKQFHPTMQQLMTTYGDKIRWVYRDYPLPFHTNAQKESEAGNCILSLGGNDAFWNYTDKIFDRTTSNGTGIALTQLGPLAAEVGVDQTAFQSCLDTGKFTQKVKDEITDGNTAGVNGTPSTVIVAAGKPNQVLVGAQPIEAMKAAIDTALK